MQEHSERGHSIIGASSAERWLECPGSIRQSWGVPGKASYEAAEGTAAHQVCEMCLADGSDASAHIGRSIKVEDFEFEVDEEMAESCQVYIDLIRSDIAALPGCDAYGEQHFNLDWVHKPDLTWLHRGNVPDSLTDSFGGTADFCIVQFMGLIKVYDFKYGKGIAKEASTPQLKIYALGALGPDNRYEAEVAELVIVQPRAYHHAGPIRRVVLPVEELYRWADEVLRPGVKACCDPNAPLKPGDHCKLFCSGMPTCPKAAEAAIAVAKAAFSPVADDVRDPATLSAQLLAEHYEAAEFLTKWVKAVKTYMLDYMKAGNEVPGYKLVQGRATRTFKEGVTSYLVDKYGYDAVYTKPEPKSKSPAQMEEELRKLGKSLKEAKEELADLVESTRSLAVAKDSDARISTSWKEQANAKAAAVFSQQ